MRPEGDNDRPADWGVTRANRAALASIQSGDCVYRQASCG